MALFVLLCLAVASMPVCHADNGVFTPWGSLVRQYMQPAAITCDV